MIIKNIDTLIEKHENEYTDLYEAFEEMTISSQRSQSIAEEMINLYEEQSILLEKALKDISLYIGCLLCDNYNPKSKTCKKGENNVTETTDEIVGQISNVITKVVSIDACYLAHVVDDNNDGKDDTSYNSGIAEGYLRGQNAQVETDLTDLFPKILGSVSGFFISTTGNMSVGGITVLSVLSLLILAVIAMYAIKVMK